MTVSRRRFLQSGAAIALAPAAALAKAKPLAGLKIGVTDWNLRQTGKLQARPSVE